MKNSLKKALDSFHAPPRLLSDRDRRSRFAWIAAMYALGLAHWALFFDLGRIKFNVHDWELMLHYLLGLDQAISTGQLPLHVLPTTPWHQTERFLANPDLPLSPQVMFVSLLEPGQFVMVDALIMFSLGFLGLLMLARKFDLSAFAFTLLFLLFALNGHITAHLGVGHLVWLGYFLTPFVILLVMNAIERGTDQRWPPLVALLLFAMMLQGAFHFVIWSVLLLVLLALTESKLRRSVLVATIMTLALGAIRLLPAIFEFAAGDWSFIGGFQAVGDIAVGLLSLITPIEAANEHYGPPEWWEVDYFIGLVGVGVLVIFGVAYWFRNPKADNKSMVGALAPAMIIMTFLSLDLVFRTIANLPIPFIGAERVSSRLFVYPFLLLIVFSVVALQRWLDAENRGTTIKLLLVAAIAAIGLDLLQHSRVWRPSAAQLGFEVFSPNLFVAIQNRNDPEYFNSLIAGAAITAIALLYALWRIFRVRDSSQKLEA